MSPIIIALAVAGGLTLFSLVLYLVTRRTSVPDCQVLARLNMLKGQDSR